MNHWRFLKNDRTRLLWFSAGAVAMGTGIWAMRFIAMLAFTLPIIVRYDLSKRFEPFFTTKAVGKGTGQGLALVYSLVVHKHGGQIRCESRPSDGAAFVLRPPLTERPTDAEVAA